MQVPGIGGSGIRARDIESGKRAGMGLYGIRVRNIGSSIFKLANLAEASGFRTRNFVSVSC